MLAIAADLILPRKGIPFDVILHRDNCQPDPQVYVAVAIVYVASFLLEESQCVPVTVLSMLCMFAVAIPSRWHQL